MKTIEDYTIKQLEAEVGSLSSPSKMPAFGYSLPATRCKVGKKLHKVPDSVCNSCYALKGRYMFSNVQNALEKRYNALMNNPMWEFYMVELIRRKNKGKYFRWHDSGDIQSVAHLRKIAFIAEQLPDKRFWIPTRETGIISEYLDTYGSFPKNLCVRVSNHMVDGHKFNDRFPNTSSVISTPKDAGSKNICQATIKGNDPKCGDCRKCWNTRVKNINYLVH